MSEFKVGDVVECIESSDDGFDGAKGRRYEVTGINRYGSIQIRYGGLFNTPDRFKPVTIDKEPSTTSVSITRVGDISKVELVGEFTEKQINAIMGITYGWSK